jgi:hypothetical protein
MIDFRECGHRCRKPVNKRSVRKLGSAVKFHLAGELSSLVKGRILRRVFRLRIVPTAFQPKFSDRPVVPTISPMINAQTKPNFTSFAHLRWTAYKKPAHQPTSWLSRTIVVLVFSIQLFGSNLLALQRHRIGYQLRCHTTSA